MRHPNWSDESVTPTRQGFNEPWVFRIVGERQAKFLNCDVDCLIEVAELRLAPQPLFDFVAGDQLSSALEEHGKNLEWLLLQANTDARLSQFARMKIQFEDSEAEQMRLFPMHHVLLAWLQLRVHDGCLPAD